MNKSALRPNQSALLSAIALAAVITLIPWVQSFLRPLVYLNTHLHELCHALVTVATGGEVSRIIVNADGSGLTPVAGGNIYLIACAGYLGATILGAAIIRLGTTANRARTIFGGLSLVLALSMVIWVRGDFVGILSGILWVAVLGAGGAFLRGQTAIFICQFIGVEQCLTSITSVYNLLQISVIGDVHSDAEIMQSQTHIPSMIWAGVWCLFSLIMIGLTARSVWKMSERPPSSPSV